MGSKPAQDLDSKIKNVAVDIVGSVLLGPGLYFGVKYLTKGIQKLTAPPPKQEQQRLDTTKKHKGEGVIISSVPY